MDKITQHEDFINAINSKNKIRLTFFSNEDNGNLERVCAPFDFGPSRRKGEIIDNGKNKYHFWDYDSDTEQHTLSLTSNKIKHLEVLSDKFDPRVDFNFNIDEVDWFIPRNW